MSRPSPQSKSGVRPAEARPPSGGWRGRLHEVIFEADTRAGRAFDVTLIILIIFIPLSVLAVMLESVGGVRERYGAELYAAGCGREWISTSGSSSRRAPYVERK